MSIYEYTLTAVSIPACMGLLGMVQATLSSDAAFVMFVRHNIKTCLVSRLDAKMYKTSCF